MVRAYTNSEKIDMINTKHNHERIVHTRQKWKGGNQLKKLLREKSMSPQLDWCRNWNDKNLFMIIVQ